MRCEICNGHYKLLGNHVWQAHGISCRDYKIKYNLPLTKALADDDWIDKMKKLGNQISHDRLTELANLGKQYNYDISNGLKKSTATKRNLWPKCSKDKVDCFGANVRRQTADDQFEQVLDKWNNGVPIKQLGVSDCVIYRWKKEGKLKERKRKVFNKKPNQTTLN